MTYTVVVMHSSDFPTARERAEALKSWLDRGGFYPEGLAREEVDSHLSNVLQQTAD